MLLSLLAYTAIQQYYCGFLSKFFIRLRTNFHFINSIPENGIQELAMKDCLTPLNELSSMIVIYKFINENQNNVPNILYLYTTLINRQIFVTNIFKMFIFFVII